jgi:F0F1-type ATP synthase assembly protein I
MRGFPTAPTLAGRGPVRPTRAGGGGPQSSRGDLTDRRPGKRGMAEAASGLSLAFEFAGAVFLFWFLGRLVDNWLNTEPWGQVVGSLLGWAGGFAHVYYATQRREKREREN